MARNVFMRYMIYALIAALIASLSALGIERNKTQRLSAKITQIEIQSDTIMRIHSERVKSIEENYQDNMELIAHNYDAVIKRLREQSAASRAPAVAAECESERDKNAARMRAELLRAYAAVARYADELRVVGGNCERIAE